MPFLRGTARHFSTRAEVGGEGLISGEQKEFGGRGRGIFPASNSCVWVSVAPMAKPEMGDGIYSTYLFHFLPSKIHYKVWSLAPYGWAV